MYFAVRSMRGNDVKAGFRHLLDTITNGRSLTICHFFSLEAQSTAI